jgi:hypothetical protein
MVELAMVASARPKGFRSVKTAPKDEMLVPKALSSSHGEISRTIPSFCNCLSFFLNQIVIVELEDFSISGRFLHYQMYRAITHRPLILILETVLGKALIRGDFLTVSIGKVKANE